MIIGREGEQPFLIEGSRVSKHHCEVKVENGVWAIRDLNSTNGTFIRDDKTGKYIPVSGSFVTITGYTFICLGSNTGDGCTFYAWSLYHPGDYDRLVALMREKEDEFDHELRKIKQRVRWQKVLMFVLNVVLFGVSFIDGIDQDVRMWMLRVVPLCSSAFAVFYDASDAKAKVNARRELFRSCPNPECHHVLTDRDFKQGSCRECGISLPK